MGAVLAWVLRILGAAGGALGLTGKAKLGAAATAKVAGAAGSGAATKAVVPYVAKTAASARLTSSLGTLAKYGLTASAIGAISKALAGKNLTASETQALTDSLNGSGAIESSDLGSMITSGKLSNKQFNKLLNFQREMAYLQTVKEVVYPVISNPVFCFVAGVSSIDLLEKNAGLPSDTATLLKTAVITDAGIKAAAQIIDAVVPG